MRLVVVVALLGGLTFPQAGNRPVSDREKLFKRYPAGTFSGRPASARIVTRAARSFRTRLREGAKAGPNFAGHYTIVQWGCGSGCADFAIVDANTGVVNWAAPFQNVGFDVPESKGLIYQVDSRLLIV